MGKGKWQEQRQTHANYAAMGDGRQGSPKNNEYIESSILIGGIKRWNFLLLNVIVIAQIKHRYAATGTAIRSSRNPIISRDAPAMDFRFPMIFLWSASYRAR